jgi:threonine dehydrogenase-like Zn-dependent dehydrogenase
MDRLRAYRGGWLELPAENLAWQLYGAGLENLGRNGQPARLPMPDYGPRELLARVDAIGICASDVKLIAQGPSHPRITGRDLAGDPVIPGHEVSLTIVGVGDDLQDRFAVGQRYVVQADIYYGGVNIAYGYALAGGMGQYGVLGKEILEGDEGCYLIPVKPDTGYGEAALTEPWACVVASYRISPRQTMKPGGVALFVGPPALPRYRLPRHFRPAKVVLAAVGESIGRSTFGSAEIIEIAPIHGPELTALSQEQTGGRGFDDIVVLGRTEPELIEQLGRHLAKGGVLNMVATGPTPRPVSIDVGRVHYDATLYVGGSEIGEGYGRSRGSELIPGGSAWFIGAAGPMGQMHVERAVQMKNGPSRILATDVDAARLEALRDRVEATAKEKWIDIRFVNPAGEGETALAAAVEALTGGAGFDDIVVLAPVPALIEEACSRLADGGVMNIFAGVPRGTIAALDLSSVYLRGVRWVGSSGSRPADLEYTLHEAESGNLATNRSVAAIGGIDAVWDGVKAVKDARFPGKIVIFPQISRLPLVALPDLKDVLPGVYARLDAGRFWTRAAEEELLREML